MKKIIATSAVFALITVSLKGFAAANYQTQNYTPNYAQNQYVQPLQPLHGRVSMVPAGVNIPVVTTAELNSSLLVLGQNVSLVLPQDYYYNNTLVAASGSYVNGTVTLAKKASFGTRNGQLQIRFTTITTPQGQTIPISGLIKTDDGTGILKGGTAIDTTKEIAKDVAIGSAGGAVTGLVVSAISGGSLGKGTAITTGIGAGAGLIKSGFDKGKDVIVPANSRVDIVIDQPITVNVMPKY